MDSPITGYNARVNRFGPARRFLRDRGLPGSGTRRPYGQLDRTPRPRRSGRFGLWGPMPYYSTRTRRGSEVSVGGCGCCLPIPILVAAGAFGALRTVWRWLR
ncbi:MAG: hypothetical protein QOI36_576 [Pseudonocardiales bacterium]|jgi:hypothetical protein|nr:hypothetical protein [Pseudonocardia sp.]MDT7649170.1 hypothetical protein [Pseudonocardiales bacterium]